MFIKTYKTYKKKKAKDIPNNFFISSVNTNGKQNVL